MATELTVFDKLIAFGALAAVAASAYLGASAWAIAGGALTLTSIRAEDCFAFADRYGAALGRLEAGSLFAVATAARSAIVCGAAYASGQVLWLCT